MSDEMAVVVGDVPALPDRGAAVRGVRNTSGGRVRVAPYAEDAAFFVNVFEFS
mgnify:CR=1 FL=1